MCLAEPPCADSRSTSCSRWVNGLDPATKDSSARTGSITRSPACTRRMASANWSAGVSFTTNPLAPASRARRKYPGRSNVVTIRHLVPLPPRAISCAASNPLSTGISMSSRATSTSWSVTAATASRPLPAWATTQMSGSSSSSAASPARTNAWSSAITTEMVFMPAPPQFEFLGPYPPRARSRSISTPLAPPVLACPAGRSPERTTPPRPRRGARNPTLRRRR